MSGILRMASLVVGVACMFAVGAADWNQFLGPTRDGVTPEVPAALPKDLKPAWTVPMKTKSYAGLAATAERVIVTDQDAENKQDLVHCVDAATGKVLWTWQSPNEVEELGAGYGSAIRATPAILNNKVYVFTGIGVVACLNLADGKEVWKLECEKTFKAATPEYGFCASPLILGADKLVISPCGSAGLAALDAATGKVVWQTKCGGSAHASHVVGQFGGAAQIVGWDGDSVAGFDPATGKQLWTVNPEAGGAFNVGSCVNVAGKLFYATEKDCARVHSFEGGKPKAEPDAKFESLIPDSATPLFYKNCVWGSQDAFYCLNPDDLTPRWQDDKDGDLSGFTCLIGGNDRVLVYNTANGKVTLLAANAEKCEVLGKAKVCEGSMCFPALAGGRLFARDDGKLYGYNLK